MPLQFENNKWFVLFNGFVYGNQITDIHSKISNKKIILSLPRIGSLEFLARMAKFKVEKIKVKSYGAKKYSSKFEVTNERVLIRVRSRKDNAILLETYEQTQVDRFIASTTLS